MPRILLADDDATIREVLRMLLEDEGYEVLEAVDGEDALRIFQLHPFDLLVCDVFMPGKDALQIIPALRRENPKLKIIAISGGGYNGAINMLPVVKLLGANEVFNKPVSPGRILASVRRLLGMTPVEGHAVP